MTKKYSKRYGMSKDHLVEWILECLNGRHAVDIKDLTKREYKILLDAAKISFKYSEK